MIELIFVTCLVTAPTECRERHLQFIDVSVMECMMGAQPQLAEWAVQNPKWQVGRWKCQNVLTAERKA